MKKLIVECATCNAKMTLEADDPMKSLRYLTDGIPPRYCRKCGNPLFYNGKLLNLMKR